MYDWVAKLCSLGATGRVMRRAADLVSVEQPTDVLDVGSGTGNLALALARRNPAATVVAVEPSEEMLTRARAKAVQGDLPVEFRQGYAQELPFGDSAFDAVTISLALHHVATDEVSNAMSELRRVLKRGGRLLVIELDPIGRIPMLLFGHHATPVRSLVEPFTSAGFDDIQTGRMSRRVLGYLLARASGDG